MAEKKKKSKFKKILKTLGKVAALGGAAYGASKLFGGKGPVSTVGQPVGVNRAAAMPTHLGETFHQKQPRVPDRIRGVPTAIPKKIWTGDQRMAPNENIWRYASKKGGRVTGAAKRGFGRALMKGKK